MVMVHAYRNIAPSGGIVICVRTQCLRSIALNLKAVNILENKYKCIEIHCY